MKKNDQTGRNGYEDLVTPKIVANADDVTCLTDSSRSNKYIFHEYDRLSILSGLILNATKSTT